MVNRVKRSGQPLLGPLPLGAGYEHMRFPAGGRRRNGTFGKATFDVYLNASAFWRNAPTAVWLFQLGGYQVLKKWLSYRESAIIGRSLRT